MSAQPNDIQARPDYTVGTIQMAAAIIEYLAQHILEPQPIAAIVEAIPGATRDPVFRALWTMERAGWVRQTAGAWELGTYFTTLGERVRLTMIQVLNSYLGDHHVSR
jgi:DNA-binding IclR family transcriptional regulator